MLLLPPFSILDMLLSFWGWPGVPFDWGVLFTMSNESSFPSSARNFTTSRVFWWASFSYSYSWVLKLKHSRQTGIYRSPPPISSTRSSTVVRSVKLAELLQILQIALSCLIFSHLGISSRTSLKGFLKEVPDKTLIMTILPSDAAFSANSTTLMTQCVKSVPYTYIFVELTFINTYTVVLFPRVTQLSEFCHSNGFFFHSIQISQRGQIIWLTGRVLRSKHYRSEYLPQISHTGTSCLRSVVYPSVLTAR